MDDSSEDSESEYEIHRLGVPEWQFCCESKLFNSSHDCDIDLITSTSSCEHLLGSQVLRVLVWIVGLSSLFGNLFVLFLRVGGFRSIKSPSARVQALMILSLAGADCFNGVYLIIIASADVHFGDLYYLSADSWLQSVVCKMAGFFATISSAMSVLMLTLISIDRMLAVLFPFKLNRRFTVEAAASTIMMLWIIILFICCIPFIFPVRFDGFYGNTDVCIGLPVGIQIYTLPGSEAEVEGTVWNFGIGLYIALNLFCLVIMFVCYSAIFVVVRRSAMRANRIPELNKEIRLAGKMAMIVGTDFVTWMPIVIMFILVLSNVWTIPAQLYAYIVVFLLPINSALNPYIYTLVTLVSKKKKRQGLSEKSSDSTRPVSLQNLT